MAETQNAIGCDHASIDYENNPNLTQQEKTILMDQALQRSLNQYGHCQENLTKAANAPSDSENSNRGESGNASQGGSTSSTASSQMSGTEAAARPSIATNSTDNNKANDTFNGLTEAPMNEQADKGKQHNRLKGSGKMPGDIPPTDNDSVLEAQIRQAAIAETKPSIKAQLWNEYRKYKGLPTK